MPNPADLPQELFHLVPDHALTAEEPDAQRLCSLSLLSRNWTLWKFLRTVRQNPHLAARVQTLKIGNWGFYPKAAVQGGDFRPAADEVELVRRAIHDAGIGHLEQRIIESLAKKDRRSLMALLLASLPNLVTVHAHVPMSDPVLGEVLRQTLEPRGRDEVHPLPGHEPQIPGMVKRYKVYGQVLFICPEQNWRQGQRTLLFLQFDEFDGLSSVRTECRPINVYSPAHDLDAPSSEGPVDDDMHWMAWLDRDGWLGVWQKATSRGWTGWI
ncbi:hypothetical protein ASPWEDRAFT_179887 [Aspergillus wentii DTO 134E9]|uniref:Uncharacterized protein n=1 Tax=Aspergillus wentii DTO 134E9 TaxID=1073089 RepID=A0A1L9RTW4_ASPWE|nr:uncharacterized protein ASPWEDRAFT_179887 [Aspergillus wentii DTO 134E9]OJJ38323.1 hypothetical protein ASPWEDRAFT_179887 [Aspergillus wentii DTO 134E9]